MLMRMVNLGQIFQKVWPKGAAIANLQDTPAGAVGSAGKIDIGTPISRQKLSHARHEGKDFRNLKISDLNAADSEFVSCDFSYAIFERGYFHAAKFESCKFTGSRFYDCNFRASTFYLCDLRYATFHRTIVEAKELLATLPQEPNLRRDILQNLRANAVEIGDFRSQQLYVLEEVKAKADHLSRAMRSSESYYKRKYGTISARVKATLELTGLWLSGFVWGHGERAWRILFSGALWLVILSILNFWSVLPRLGWDATASGTEVFRYCLNMLLDASPNQTFKGFDVVDYALIAMRYVYIGLFISVLFKGISHR